MVIFDRKFEINHVENSIYPPKISQKSTELIAYLNGSKRFSFHDVQPDNLLKFQIVNFD